MSAHELDPDEDSHYDLIGVPDLLAENPTEESVEAVRGALSIAASIGSVCELAAVTKFFNGNPLATVSGGLDYFTGKAGLKHWHDIGEIIDRGWDNVIDAIDAIMSTPDVDESPKKPNRSYGRQENELDEPNDAVDEDEPKQRTRSRRDADETEEAEEADEVAETEEDPRSPTRRPPGSRPTTHVLGSDEDFWHKVGIDPVRMITSAGTFYTLRCYLDDEPVFLGRNGRVSVFGSGGSLARYLADEHDHDLSDLATYDDIRTAATDGSLRVDVTDDNVYVLKGLADDIADGPDAVDRDQLELAVELLRDVGEYSEDTIVEAGPWTPSAAGPGGGPCARP